MPFDFSLERFLKRFEAKKVAGAFDEGAPWYENPRLIREYRRQRRIRNRIARRSRRYNMRREAS